VIGLLGSSESTVQCPNNTCAILNQYGQIEQFYAFAGLGASADNYYANWGPGGIYDSSKQAGIASAQWGAWYLEQTGSEVGGSVWCGEICSSTLQQPGEPGAGAVMMEWSFSDIPEGAAGQGWWRATNGESPGSDLQNVDNANSALGTSLPLYTGTTSGPGRVLYYGPENGWNECVLVGGVWARGNEGPC